MNPRSKNALAADTTIQASLLGTKANLCHMGQKCVRHCQWPIPDAGHVKLALDRKLQPCHDGACWPKDDE